MSKFNLLIISQRENLRTGKRGRKYVEKIGTYASEHDFIKCGEIKRHLESRHPLDVDLDEDLQFLNDVDFLREVFAANGGKFHEIEYDEVRDDLINIHGVHLRCNTVLEFVLQRKEPKSTDSEGTRTSPPAKRRKTKTEKFRAVRRFRPGDEDCENFSEEEEIGEYDTMDAAVDALRSDIIEIEYGGDEEKTKTRVWEFNWGRHLEKMRKDGKGWMIEQDYEYTADCSDYVGYAWGERHWGVTQVEANWEWARRQ